MSRLLLSCVALAVLFCGAQAFMPPVSDDGFYRGGLFWMSCIFWWRGKRRIGIEKFSLFPSVLNLPLGPNFSTSSFQKRKKKNSLSFLSLPFSLKNSSGRATFFGAPDDFANAYKMDRGEGSFGDFLFGSCGYFNKPRSKQKIDYDDLQLPLDGVAALADVNPDFPGSCGRCYEVRCSEGLLKSNRGDPIWLSEMYYMPQGEEL